jgi:hypothetical protein
MTDDTPLACSLSDGELRRRLAAIAEVGESSLLSRTADDKSHSLRFRPDPTTRRQLEGIVAAEAECCPFLELSLREEGDDLILSIAAPEAGAELAAELARAFGGAAPEEVA